MVFHRITRITRRHHLPSGRSPLRLVLIALGAAAMLLLATRAVPVPAVQAQAPSPGCALLNRPGTTQATGVNLTGLGDPVTFFAGDQLRITASSPENSSFGPVAGPIELVLNNAVVASIPYPGTITYTIPTTNEYHVFVQVRLGAPTWQFACTPAPPPADLRITKTDLPDPVVAGADLTYTIGVTNAGPGAAQSVQLSDTLPANTTFVSFTTPTGWTASTPAVGATGTVSASRAMLAADAGPQSFTLVVRIATTAGASLSNTATVMASNDPTPTNNSVTTTTQVTPPDTTPPMISCSASPNQLWPPNHRLVPVTVAVTAADAGGPVTVTLLSVTSSEPDNGQGDGDTAGDIQGWAVGTDDRSGQLRGERAGGGTGRVYTLTYRATDQAGNTASATCTVRVPHNRVS